MARSFRILFFIYKQYTKFTRKLQERQRDYFATYFHFRECGCGIYVFLHKPRPYRLTMI